MVSEAAPLEAVVPEAAGKPVHSLIRKLVIRASLKSEAHFVSPMVKLPTLETIVPDVLPSMSFQV